MRIVTPQNAAFLPDGSGGGNPSLPRSDFYELVETVNADFGPTLVDLFVPSSGQYLFAVYAETQVAAGAGTLNLSIDQPGGPIAIATLSIDLAVIGIGGGYNGNFNIIPVQSTYGVIQISRTVTGLAAGPTTYRITAAAYKLC